MATITTLACFDSNERCDSCTLFHAVQQGGPPAAIDKAIRYLDAYHQEDRLKKVQTAIRCSECQ